MLWCVCCSASPVSDNIERGPQALTTCFTLQISPVYATVFVASMLFPALSTIFKEQIFTKAKETLKGKQLDIFVVRRSPQPPAMPDMPQEH